MGITWPHPSLPSGGAGSHGPGGCPGGGSGGGPGGRPALMGRSRSGLMVTSQFSSNSFHTPLTQNIKEMVAKWLWNS